VFVPTQKICRRQTFQRLVSVSILRAPFEREVNRALDGEPDELGAHPLLGRRDTLEISSALVIDFDKDPFHIEEYILGDIVRKGWWANESTGVTALSGSL
jgi:hypothetical protein